MTNRTLWVWQFIIWWHWQFTQGYFTYDNTTVHTQWQFMSGTGSKLITLIFFITVTDKIKIVHFPFQNLHTTRLRIPTATQFAKEMGFRVESLSTNGSVQMWKDWRAKHCQPNYRKVQVHFTDQLNALWNQCLWDHVVLKTELDHVQHFILVLYVSCVFFNSKLWSRWSNCTVSIKQCALYPAFCLNVWLTGDLEKQD